jgi:hypothetical protein
MDGGATKAVPLEMDAATADGHLQRFSVALSRRTGKAAVL